jgi:hypothetical protein
LERYVVHVKFCRHGNCPLWGEGKPVLCFMLARNAAREGGPEGQRDGGGEGGSATLIRQGESDGGSSGSGVAV